MKASRNTYEGIDPELVKIVKSAASRAIGKAGLTRNDLPDIEQELMIAALEGLDRQKNIENEAAFVRSLVSTQLNLLFRNQNRRSKRWLRRQISLNVSVELDSGDLDELINLVDTENLLRNNSFSYPDPYQDIDLAENVKELILALPENLQEFCRALKTRSIQELSQGKRKSANLPSREISRLKQDWKKQEVLNFFLQ
jgi:DNA-directed RNA polymerase specialized sigma24 family protein